MTSNWFTDDNYNNFRHFQIYLHVETLVTRSWFELLLASEIKITRLHNWKKFFSQEPIEVEKLWCNIKLSYGLKPIVNSFSEILTKKLRVFAFNIEKSKVASNLYILTIWTKDMVFSVLTFVMTFKMRPSRSWPHF